MIEIALCLAIIGFALVAIIGVLPTGMDVQKQNREETIINQEATVWMDAIRSGARGYDDLTNYVIGITNLYRDYTINNGTTNAGNLNTAVYTRTASTLNGSSIPFLLNTGSNIVGILSSPKYIWTSPDTFRSNYISAAVYALSGSVVEKVPQNDPDLRSMAFSYRLVPEIVPYVPFDPESADFAAITNGAPGATNSIEFTTRYSRYREIAALSTNSYDIRLAFAWPLTPSGIGNGRQTFRLFTTGSFVEFRLPDNTLYFLQPSVYVSAK